MGWELVASIITKAAATEKLQNDDYSQKFETICANIYFFLFFLVFRKRTEERLL